MTALLSSANRTRGGIKWGLVVHTITMFSFVMIDCFTNFAIQSISYIDNRAFTGDEMYPGPFGYQLYTISEPINVVPSVTFYLNNWLADGLLVGSASDSVVLIAYGVVLPALSLLYNLWQEQLDLSPPVLNVPHVPGYVPVPSAS